jgi:hypothetical protein
MPTSLDYGLSKSFNFPTVVSTKAHEAVLGINKFWTLKTSRQNSYAKKLLDQARQTFIPSYIIPRVHIAWMYTNDDEAKFAKKNLGRKAQLSKERKTSSLEKCLTNQRDSGRSLRKLLVLKELPIILGMGQLREAGAISGCKDISSENSSRPRSRRPKSFLRLVLARFLKPTNNCSMLLGLSKEPDLLPFRSCNKISLLLRLMIQSLHRVRVSREPNPRNFDCVCGLHRRSSVIETSCSGR